MANQTCDKQPLQSLDRLGRDGVSLQDLQVRIGGRRGLGQGSFQQPPHAQKNRGPLNVRAQAHLTGESLDQTPDVPHRIQDAHQLAQLAHVLRLDLAGLAQRGRGCYAVTQTLLLHVRNPQQDFSALGWVLQARLAHVLQVDQIGPALAVRVELEQGIFGLVIPGYQGQDTLGESLEIIRTLHPLAGDEQAPAQKGELLLRIRPLRRALIVQPGSQQSQ